MLRECGGKELDRSFNEKSMMKFDGEDEEFIIRCSQLALNQKNRWVGLDLEDISLSPNGKGDESLNFQKIVCEGIGPKKIEIRIQNKREVWRVCGSIYMDDNFLKIFLENLFWLLLPLNLIDLDKYYPS